MKQILLVTSLVMAIALGVGFSQSDSSRGTASVEIAGKEISIEYGRPQLDGRDMLGQAHNGMVWRMGMNQPTVMATEATLHFDQQQVEPGKYLLVAQKEGPQQWNLIINSDPSASANTRNSSQDVATVSLSAEENASSVETFTIELTVTGDQTGRFSMAWGELTASTEFQVK